MTWLCANRSPRHPDPVADADKAEPVESDKYKCDTCSTSCRLLLLRGTELYVCPHCNRTTIGRGDLYRLVNEYAGTKGWFPIKTWYSYYWLEPDDHEPLRCLGCGAPVRGRRFLHEEGARLGFCDECALAVGTRKDILELTEHFRSRIENGFLHD